MYNSRQNRAKPQNMRLGSELHGLLYEQFLRVYPNLGVAYTDIHFYDQTFPDVEYPRLTYHGQHNIDVNTMPSLRKVLDEYGLRSNDPLAGIGGATFQFGNEVDVDKDLSPAMERVGIGKRANSQYSTGYSPRRQMLRRDLVQDFQHDSGHGYCRSSWQGTQGGGAFSEARAVQDNQSSYSNHGIYDYSGQHRTEAAPWQSHSFGQAVPRDQYQPLQSHHQFAPGLPPAYNHGQSLPTQSLPAATHACPPTCHYSGGSPPSSGSACPPAQAPAPVGLHEPSLVEPPSTTITNDGVHAQFIPPPSAAPNQKPKGLDLRSAKVIFETSHSRQEKPSKDVEIPRLSAVKSVTHEAPDSFTNTVKRAISGRKDHTSLPNFSHEEITNEGSLVHFTKWNPDTTYTVEVTKLAVMQVLDLQHDEDGYISYGKEKKNVGSKKAEFVKTAGRQVLPRPFGIRADLFRFYPANCPQNPNAKKPAKADNRGGKKPTHDKGLFWHGYCSHSTKGCHAEYSGGIMGSDLMTLCKKTDDETIPIHFELCGHCSHYLGDKGELRGLEREAIVDAINQGEHQKKLPSQIARDETNALSDEDYALGNGVDRDTVYDIKRDAKAKKKKSAGIGADLMEGLASVKRIIIEEDLSNRRKACPEDEVVNRNCLGALIDENTNHGFCMALSSFSSMIIYAHLAEKGSLCVGMDASGAMLQRPRLKKSDDCQDVDIQHLVMSIQPVEVFTNSNEYMIGKSLYSMLCPLELVTNCQTAEVVESHLRNFSDKVRLATGGWIGMDRKIKGGMTGHHILLRTDVAPGIQNGSIYAYRKEGQVNNRIIYHNLVVYAMLFMDTKFRQCESEEERKKAAKSMMDWLKVFVPHFLKFCSSHVYRAFGDWPTVATLGPLKDIIEDLFRHTGKKITAEPSMSRAIAYLCSVIIILEVKSFPCPSFGLEDTPTEHHDRAEVCQVGIEQANTVSSSASLIELKSEDELYEKAKEVMSENNKFSKHFLNGREVARQALDALSTHRFWHVHLVSVDKAKGTAVVRIRIVYDIETDKEGSTRGVTLNYSEETIPFPTPPGYKLKNPLHSNAGAVYLTKYWLKEPAMWGDTIIQVLSLALDQHVQQSNQLCEAYFKHKKSMKYELTDACTDPGSYLHYWWGENRKECQVFNRELESFKRKMTARRKKKKMKNTKLAKLTLGELEVPTVDAIANAEADLSTPQWKPGHRGKKAENAIMLKLNLIFDDLVPRPRSIDAKMMLLKLHLDSTQVGGLKGMGKSTWGVFIQGRRPREAKKIPEQVMRLFESYIRHNEWITTVNK